MFFSSTPANQYVIPFPPNLPHHKQSVPVPRTKTPGQTAHYRNAVFGLIDINTPRAFKTLVDVFHAGLGVGPDRPFLGHRPLISTKPVKYADHYVWQSYGQVDIRRRNIGSALVHLFRKGELGGGDLDTVGIWSGNRPEWQIIDLALQAYNKVSVSLYDTLGKDSVEYIINHAHLTVVFATFDHVSTLLKLASKIPNLKLIVSIDTLSPEARNLLTSWGQSVGIQVTDLQDIEALGQANLIDIIIPSPDDIASICYTSGTTSNPKGVVLKHKNLSMATFSNLHGISLPEDSSLLSYLPLAHIYERITELATTAVGGKIGYFTGDPLRLLEDAQILKPNFFPSVPRVLNRVYQSAMIAGNVGGVKTALFRKAIQAKLDKLHMTGDNTHALWDKLVFRKIHAVLGGNLKLVTSGSAPISPDVMDFLKIAFSCEVSEGKELSFSRRLTHAYTHLLGYGMTENCATTSRTWPLDPSSSGTVGPPQPLNEVKLIDVPAMGYSSEDKPNPRGELCVRGLNCFTSYYKDEKNTAEAVDEHGWIHTGDVAEIDQCGRLKIIDRVKNIMKLAQGEYVALEKIENMYGGCPVVQQIYVHGDSLQSFLLAVVVPDPVQFSLAIARATGSRVSPQDVQALTQACKDERVVEHVFHLLSKEAKKNGLKGFEAIKRIHLTLDPFSVEDGTMTPTLKLRRKDAYQKFKAEIDALYSLGEPSATGTKL